MKKKFLIALFIAIMVCLFALATSASNEVTLVSGEKVDFETVFKVGKSNDVENVVTGFNTDYDKNSVTDVIFPDYLAGIECNGLFGAYATPASTTIRTLTFEATDEFFISGDNIFTSIPITKVTFNPNCVVELRKGNFSSCTSLTQITFPKFKTLAGNAFAGCSNMVSTNELVFAEGMTVIGKFAFDGCTSLWGTVYFPSTLKEIVEGAFRNTGFEYFDLSKCASLEKVGHGGAGGPFSNNNLITTLDLSGCTSLTTLNKSFAESCDELISVTLPPNLVSVPYKAFAHCYKMQSIVIPKSVTDIADESFHSARAGQTVKTFTMYIQGNVKLNTKYVFRDSGAKIEFVMIGDGITASQFKTTNAGIDIVQSGSHSPLDNIEVINYLDKASPWTFVPGGERTSHIIVDNYCKSLALTGKHAEGTNTCVINCEICHFVGPRENPVHIESIVVTYENGFDNVGSRYVCCSNEGCDYEQTTEAPIIFVCLGYSTPQDDRKGIAIGFRVDNDAIASYNLETGNTLAYGVFAVSKDNVGTSDIFDSNVNKANGVINAEITSYEFEEFSLKIMGFDDAHMDSKLAIGAYVAVTENESTTYKYMQYGTPEENESYCFVSYNSVMDLLKSQEVA